MTQEARVISRLNDFGESFERQHSTYGSGFVKSMIQEGGIWVSPATGTVYAIPTHFGFCYGVEKSIDMAFETTRRFPDRRIFLTHDVIHNARVNEDLSGRGVQVLDRDPEGRLVLDDLKVEDIVVISAFGSRFSDVESLRNKGCLIVDTTCGAIVMVWKRVEKYARSGYSSVIHGIWNHEETQATASQAVKFGGHFLIVRDLADAGRIAGFLKGSLSGDQFIELFKNHLSIGFRPALHLERIGIASQTTMLKSDTLEIQEFLKTTYAEKFGVQNLKDHFMLYDTICSATQERQDALYDLLKREADLVIIIGGFNSSNTTHLSEIASRVQRTYHIRGPEDILSRTLIQHLDPFTLEVLQSLSWIPERLKCVALTTGASTPDILIEQVIHRIDEYLQ